MPRLCFFVVLLSLLVLPLSPKTLADLDRWSLENTYEVSSVTLAVYSEPNINSDVLLTLYNGMDIEPTESLIVDGYKWFKFGEGGYWIAALEPGGVTNVSLKENSGSVAIEDSYGILEQPHRYAVKLVKYPGAVGRIETYKKVGDEYVMQHTYTTTYRKEGQKSRYNDLRTAGGNVVRYIYRTKRSLMTGWDSSGQHFGVYKVSYPMPHDGLPHLLSGNISVGQYNRLPAINQNSVGMFIPHPISRMGANIVLHTKAKGSSGCINIENEAMSRLYHEDMATELDHELIPLVIYDEDVIAPKIGQLL